MLTVRGGKCGVRFGVSKRKAESVGAEREKAKWSKPQSGLGTRPSPNCVQDESE